MEKEIFYPLVQASMARNKSTMARNSILVSSMNGRDSRCALAGNWIGSGSGA